MTKKLFTVAMAVVALTCLTFWGCSKKDPVSVATTGTISGVVTDSTNSTAIAGTSIVTNPATSSVTANTTGQFSITGVNPGTYTLTASNSGYNNKSISVTVTAGNTAIANITLMPGAPGNNAPNTPNSPSPYDASTGQSIATILSWVCTDPDAGDTLKYDVYFGTTNPPAALVSSNQSAASFDRSGLVKSTTYYWKITARDKHGSTTDGPVWQFTTTSIEWISIPAGNFTMGSLPGDPYAQTDELPQHIVYLDAYQISKYEITNSQYKAFMDAGGYSNIDYWTTEGWTWRTIYNVTEPAYWTAESYNSGMAFPNHPVVGVSWYEANAFCNWAGVHLPTEAQWEKAARYTDARYYPWGSTWDGSKCNSSDNTPPDTFALSSPVGFFLAGASDYGVYDMAGNASEWCNDWYVSYPGSSSPFDYTGSSRVLRSASFGSHDNNCRSANRTQFPTSDRYVYTGFRPAK